jgi:ABC-2 type transport system permease protein
MNTPSNTIPESPQESQVLAPAVISATQRMYWSVRRELWENRSIYIAPLAVAAVVLVTFLIGMFALPHHRMRAVFALDPAKQRAAIELPYDLAAGLILATAFVVGLFYCLDALQGERRDRSILFWKSLPVSDLTTVLSKASIPFVLLLFSFAVTVVTQFIMLLLSSAVVLANGLSVATLWTHVSLFQRSLMLLYHLLTVHGLWYAPLYGYLLLVSAWARRAPFLWAALPPFVICVVERMAFTSSYFAAMLLTRVVGPEPSTRAPAGTPMDPMSMLVPHNFFSEPGLWIGLAVAAVCLAATVRMRRYRGPI